MSNIPTNKVAVAACPFCGGTDTACGIADEEFGRFWVECICGARGPTVETLKDARPAWNKRLAPEPSGDLATLKRLWAADCDDIDRLLGRLGLGDKETIAQEYRSEGGFLRGGKVENAIREKLALRSTEPAAYTLRWPGCSLNVETTFRSLSLAKLYVRAQGADESSLGEAEQRGIEIVPLYEQPQTKDGEPAGIAVDGEDME